MSEEYEIERWPTDVKIRPDRKSLALAFDDGVQVEISAELLRVESPSAEVQGHSASGKKLVAGKRNVLITGAEPVGNYAIRLSFDDGHSTGIYSWRYLYKLGGPEGEKLWADYLAALGSQDLARE